MSTEITIRRAEDRDLARVKELLSQVLTIHSDIRPDIFIAGTTKYTDDELKTMFRDDSRPIYVAVNDEDTVLGYAFCVIEEQPRTNNMLPMKTVYIDDLCVHSSARGMHVGRRLFEHVKSEAIAMGCYEITLNVWEGNDSARRFYEKMGLKPKKTNMEYIL